MADIMSAQKHQQVKPEKVSGSQFWANFENNFQITTDENTLIGVLYDDYAPSSIVVEALSGDAPPIQKIDLPTGTINTICLNSENSVFVAGTSTQFVAQYRLSEGSWEMEHDYGDVAIGSVYSSVCFRNWMFLGGMAAFVLVNVTSKTVIRGPIGSLYQRIWSLQVCPVHDSKVFLAINGKFGISRDVASCLGLNSEFLSFVRENDLCSEYNNCVFDYTDNIEGIEIAPRKKDEEESISLDCKRAELAKSEKEIDDSHSLNQHLDKITVEKSNSEKNKEKSAKTEILKKKDIMKIVESWNVKSRKHFLTLENDLIVKKKYLLQTFIKVKNENLKIKNQFCIENRKNQLSKEILKISAINPNLDLNQILSFASKNTNAKDFFDFDLKNIQKN